MKDTTRDSRNEKMRETYQFIQQYIHRNGYSPTVCFATLDTFARMGL